MAYESGFLLIFFLTMDTEINLLLFYVFIARNNAINLTISKGMNLYFLCNHEWTFQLMRYSQLIFLGIVLFFFALFALLS